VTNSEDGIFAARAMAAAVCKACAGAEVGEVVGGALAVLPEGSWSRRIVIRALEIGDRDSSLFALIPAFHDILNKEYSDGSVAAETLAVTLGVIAKGGGEFDRVVAAACLFAKGADSIPALVGALAGAMTSADLRMDAWDTHIRKLRGVCIPTLAGRDYLALVQDFVLACETRQHGRGIQ
jgi:ADP-ribosylglycohydrolase